MMSEPSPDQLAHLTAFEAAFCQGGRPAVGEWIERWPDEGSRFEMARSLLESAAELSGYDLAWLHDQTLDPRVPPSARQHDELLARIYKDQIGLRQQPQWDQYAAFGSPEELRLRAPQDRCYLGQRLGQRYQLLRRLGGGGLGTVYEALDAETEQSVAIKVPLGGANAVGCNEALRKEAAILEELDLPGLPRFIGLLEDDVGPALVTSLVIGKPLESLGRVDVAEALRLAAQVASILDGLHERGYVHGDIKPDNILLDDAGDVTLIDFNVSRSDDPTRTVDGFPGGTLPFMSPEAVLGVGADVDLRQDIYALGSLLYQLVTGELLISPEGKEDAVVMSVLIGGVHEPEFPSHVPDEVKQTCLAAISRQPLSRFETAGDFARTCLTVLQGETDSLEIPPVRSELHAWRLGVALGAASVRQRRITTELGDTAEPTTSTVQELAPYIAGVTASIDEVVPLAKRLGLPISTWEGVDEYQKIFYRLLKLTSEDIDELLRLAVSAEKWLRATLETVQEKLTASAPASAALYLAALQSRLAPYSSAAASRWPSVAAPAGLPDTVTREFDTACTANHREVDWDVKLKRLDYAVVRWLRWRVDE